VNRQRVAQELVKIAKELTARKPPYYDVIFPILRRMGRTDIDPRHVEAYLRLESPTSTLDDWSRAKFRRLVPEIVDVIDADPRGAEQLADSYGM